MAEPPKEAFAIEVIRAYQPRPNDDPAFVAVSRGAQAFAHPNSDPDRDSNVCIRLIGSTNSTWIPRSYVKFGVRAKAIQLKGSKPVFTSKITFDESIRKLHTLLGKAMQALAFEMRARAKELSKYTPEASLEEILAPERNYVPEMLGMMNPHVRKTIENGQFSVDDLLKLQPVTNQHEFPGIYIIVYKGIGESLQNGIYVGKSVDLWKRSIDHSTVLRSAKEPSQSTGHYRVGRTAHTWRIIPILKLPTSTPGFDQKLRLFEHCFVSLFFSWNPKLLDENFSITKLSNHFQAFTEAQIYSSLTRNVFNQIGWPILPFRGLNWSTPISESAYSRTPWTSTTSGIYLNFKRPPVGIRSTAGKYLFICLMNAHPQVLLVIPSNVGLEHGMKVYPVVQITMDGSIHQAHFTRFPAIGPFTDWSRVNSLAVYIEWQAGDGKWKRIWLQQSLFPLSEEKTVPGSGKHLYGFTCYQKISFLLDSLLLVKYDDVSQEQDTFDNTRNRDPRLLKKRETLNLLPDWRRTGRPTDVKHLELNFLQQEIVIREAPLTKPSLRIALQTIQANELALRKRYPNIIIGEKPEGLYLKSEVTRVRCDFCYISNYLISENTNRYGTCRIVEGTRSCPYCLALRRPCTWTTREDLFNKKWLDLGERVFYGDVEDVKDPDEDYFDAGSEDEDDGGDDDVENDPDIKNLTITAPKGKGKKVESTAKAQRSIKQSAQDAMDTKFNKRKAHNKARKQQLKDEKKMARRVAGEEDDDDDGDEDDDEDDDDNEPVAVEKKESGPVGPSMEEGERHEPTAIEEEDDEDEGPVIRRKRNRPRKSE